MFRRRLTRASIAVAVVGVFHLSGIASAQVAGGVAVGSDRNLVGLDAFCFVVEDYRMGAASPPDDLHEGLLRQAVLFAFPMHDCSTGRGSVVVMHLADGFRFLYVIVEQAPGLIRPVVWGTYFTTEMFAVPPFGDTDTFGASPLSVMGLFEQLVFAWRSVNW